MSNDIELQDQSTEPQDELDDNIIDTTEMDDDEDDESEASGSNDIDETSDVNTPKLDRYCKYPHQCPLIQSYVLNDNCDNQMFIFFYSPIKIGFSRNL